MSLSKEKLPVIIFTLLTVITAFASAAIYAHPVALFPDPSWGFRVMQGMQHGGGFNILSVPSQQNIADNYSQFLSWWSPGQYLLPYFFISLLHLNIGQACAITIFFCEVLGLGGFYCFFRQAGFSKIIAGISIAFIASQVFYFIPFIFYNGGELLLFAFGGWFLYGCVKFIQPKSWQMVVFVLLSGWVGFFCKSSFIWIYIAGLLFIWIKTSRGHRFLGKWLINGIWIGVPGIVSLAGIYLGYLSKGATPTSEGHATKLLWETFGFPLASPILSGFSIDDLTDGLLYHPDGPMFSYVISVIIVVVLAIASILLITRINKTVPHPDYRLMLTVFYAVCVLFFGISFFRQLAISYESRHFRIMGLLLIPGAVYLVSQLLKGYWVLFGFVWGMILISGVKYAVAGYQRNIAEQSHGVSGISQQFLDQEGLDEVIRLDKASANAVFVFISPDLGLEVQHNRVITLQAIAQDMRIDYNMYQHCGHNGPLYIVLPASYRGVKATMILKSFEDYKGFRYTQLSDDYIMYAAK